ncbi:MAG: thioredoxin [Limnohabitans sp.]|jgi:thioredoxin 1
MTSSPTSGPLHIACLCAQWCVICRSYESLFQQMASEEPVHAWHWIDIEDHEDDLPGIDIETFPTIVILNHAGEFCFAGTVEPRPDMLKRLVQSAHTGHLQLSASDAEPWMPVKALLGLG